MKLSGKIINKKGKKIILENPLSNDIQSQDEIIEFN